MSNDHAGSTPLRQDNPFEITKAVDFTHSQIDGTWVDWPAPGGFAAFMNVSSPMPRMVLGGKGTGRTHIMRHFSAPVQAIRGGGDPIGQAAEDGVLGIYVRCSGLDSSRFGGRGHDPSIWRSAFAQYADLWLAQAALGALATVTETQPVSMDVQRAIHDDVLKLVHGETEDCDSTLAGLQEHLYTIQRSIDLSVNNAALNPDAGLDFAILSSPGDLVFGIPAIVRRHYQPMENVLFLYLIDEFENFEEQQQEYVNTLVREKQSGTSFMVGVRTFGLRTLKTLGGGEENRRGSEFDEIDPDWSYRNYERTEKERNWFPDFCRGVVAQRLIESKYLDRDPAKELSERLNDFFVVPPRDYEETLMKRGYDDSDRPYLNNLRKHLSDTKGFGPVPTATEDINFIVRAVCIPERPLLEKANIFLLYREWASGHDLMDAAQQILDANPSPGDDGLIQPNQMQKRVLDYYGTDLKAQLCQEANGHGWYAGIDRFITMSDGLPRNLLVILKNIFRWSLFYGERPFQGEPISLEAQRMGVLEATDWFVADAKPIGGDGESVLAAVGKLCDLFRQSRFSNKPAECSVISFSADLGRCTRRAREVIEMAEQRSLLIPVDKGLRHRNTGITEAKFHLNRLLSPRWDLPTARRGTLNLKPHEVDAVFDPDQDGEFVHVQRDRARRLNAPFSRDGDQMGLQGSFDLDLEDRGEAQNANVQPS